MEKNHLLLFLLEKCQPLFSSVLAADLGRVQRIW